LRYENDGIVDTPAARPGHDGAGVHPPFEPREYKAIDVAAGPFCTFAIGKQMDGPFLGAPESEEINDILRGLRKQLLAQETLLKFFGLHEKQ